MKPSPRAALATRVVEVRAGRLREFLGDYDVYLARLAAEAERSAAPARGAPTPRVAAPAPATAASPAPPAAPRPPTLAMDPAGPPLLSSLTAPLTLERSV